ncbi:MAG TPA: DNA polymerase I, partial [Bacteroidia bacterium]|nr:DNA polymerase I [Bacteroidia bacterium]
MTPDHPKKLFLLDAMALVYRAYFAFSSNPRITSKGMNVSAMFGFTNTLLEILEKEKPTHMAIVFDTHAPTVRHEMDANYKAHRPDTPEDIIKAVPYVIKIAEAFKIPVLLKDGYEADDIVGTLSKVAPNEGFKVYMMTSDKDYGQLVNEHVFIYKPSNKGKPAEILGVKEVCEKFGIERPEQVIDILGLMGDAVDNIPGIPGVGEKTATQLIKEFGSVENLLQNTDKLKGKLKEKVEQNKDKAISSKQLATIICDVPLPFSLDDMELRTPDKKALIDIFNELEFKTIAVRVMKDYFNGESVRSESNTATIDTEEPKEITDSASAPTLFVEEPTPAAPEYKKVEGKYEPLADIADFINASQVAFYLVTQGNECLGLGLSKQAGEAVFISPDHIQWDKLKDFFESKNKKTGHDIKQSLNFLKGKGITIHGELFDVMIAHFLARPESPHLLPDIATTTSNLFISEYGAESRKPQKEQLFMEMTSGDNLMQICCERADVLFRLHDPLIERLNEVGAKKLFDTIEIPLEKVLSDMEVEGIKVDKNALKDISGTLQIDIEGLKKEIQDMAGREFNIDSPRQVGEILFDKLKISDKVKKTKTGQYSTSEETLAELAADFPIVKKILDYRELQKLKNTYVDSLPLLINTTTGRIHTTFNMVVAVTGRLSSDNPNLQNIPIRTERGREIRKAFIAGDEHKVLLSADYSQIELRIIASLSGDAAMIEAFKNNYDVHSATASRIYGVELNAVTPEMRRNAKTVNFGIIYGISGFGLSQRLGIARKEALDIIKQYFAQYPAIKEYMDKNIAYAKQHGYVETIMGRRRYLPDINSKNYAVRGFAERNAINAPIQGSAADMIKIAMINIHNEMEAKKFRSKMILQVHDELVFDAYPEELDVLKPLVEDKMRNAITLNVP